MVFAIIYKIATSKKDYSSLYEKIKTLGTWMHYFEDTWFIVPSSINTPSEIYDKLIPFINGDEDYLFVIKVTSDYRGWLPSKAWDWLKERTF